MYISFVDATVEKLAGVLVFDGFDDAGSLLHHGSETRPAGAQVTVGGDVGEEWVSEARSDCLC